MAARLTRIYLVRHAKAEKGPPAGESGDDARRLTPEGRARFVALARSLAPRMAPKRVLTSPAARARETAEILAAASRAPLDEVDELGSGRSTGAQLLALARRAGAGAALVGHNPELAEAIALAAAGEREVPPGTVAAVDLDARGARLAWIETPARD